MGRELDRSRTDPTIRASLLLLTLIVSTLAAAGASAQCVDGSLCNDLNDCTTNDRCVGEVCVGTAVLCADDQDPCTTPLCNPVGGCGFVFNSASCNDGNPCTLPDQCVLGVCQGIPVHCVDDGNACTTEYCDPIFGQCTSIANSASCDDGDACTSADLCSGGLCVGTPVGSCGPTAVPTLSFWSRVGLVAALAFTALMASAHWERRRPAS